MDSQSPDSSFQPSQPPHRHFGTSRTFWIFFWVLFVAAVVMGAYLLNVHGYISLGRSMSSSDVVWTAQTNDGSTWYEITAPGTKPVAHADLPNMNIVGIAHGGGKTFILAQAKDSSSTLYQYSGSSYTSVYTSSLPLADLTVSTDGTLAAFMAVNADNSTQVQALTLNTKAVSTLGAGFAPVILQVGDTKTILYMQGKSILAQSQNVTTWSTSKSIYESHDAFLPFMHIASDGGKTFALIDPFVPTDAQVWQVTGTSPIAASPMSVMSGGLQIFSQLGFVNGQPVSLGFSIASASSTVPVVASVTSLTVVPPGFAAATKKPTSPKAPLEYFTIAPSGATPAFISIISP